MRSAAFYSWLSCCFSDRCDRADLGGAIHPSLFLASRLCPTWRNHVPKEPGKQAQADERLGQDVTRPHAEQFVGAELPRVPAHEAAANVRGDRAEAKETVNPLAAVLEEMGYRVKQVGG